MFAVYKWIHLTIKKIEKIKLENYYVQQINKNEITNWFINF